MTREDFNGLIATIEAMRGIGKDESGAELTLDATIADSQAASPDDLELEAELSNPQPMTRNQWRRYCGKLRMLAKIKAELCDTLNAKHKAENSGAESGRYYMEEKPLDYVQMWLDVAANRPPAPPRRRRKRGLDRLIAVMLTLEADEKAQAAEAIA